MTDTASDEPNVTLYWLEGSRAQRIVWLLEECKGMNYKIEVFKRGKEDKLAPPELKQIHGLGKSPIIKVEAQGTEPLILAESGTMMEYLTEHFAPHLMPKRYRDGMDGKVGGETEQWLRYRFFMHYAEGSLMTPLLMALLLDGIRNAPVPFFIKPITRGIANKIDSSFLNAQFETHFSFLESQLKSSPDGGQYLCGKELTTADILMSFPLIAALTSAKISASTYPTLAAYTKALEGNEVYLRSIKKVEEITGEPFKALP